MGQLLFFWKRNNVDLITEEDRNSIQKTLCLCSITEMRESILEASKEHLEKSIKEFDC